MSKNFKFHPFTLVLLAFFASISLSLEAEDDLKFNHITVIDGLLHNSATCLAQDSAGFIWVGTQRGLNRYDGYKVDSYLNGTDLHSTVYTNRIRKIVVLEKHIWVASYKGIECFDLKTKKYINYIEENSNSLVNKSIIENIFVDSKKRIWVGLMGRLDFALITKNRNDIILKDIKIDNNSFLDFKSTTTPEVVELSNGALILMANGTLFQLVSPESNPQSLNIQPINSPFSGLHKIKANGNDLWLFYHNKAIGVRIVNGRIIQFDEVEFPSCKIVGIAFNSSHLWICSNHGITRIDLTPSANRVEFIQHSVVDQHSVSSDHQSGIFIDNQNNLWVSTYSGGVSYANIKKQQFELAKYLPIKSNKYLPNEFVLSIHEDNKGDIYVGTKFGGISKFNIKSRTFDYTIDLKEKLGVQAVVPCIDSDDDYLYAAVTYQGSFVYRINKRTLEMELVKSYSPNTIFSFGFDTHQQLWVGVLGVGLTCLKIENGKAISEKLYSTSNDAGPKLSSTAVNFVYNDKQKNEVLISTTKGLNRLILNDKGDVESVAYYFSDEKNPSTLSSNFLWPIDKENDSVYWIGTMGSGLNRITIGKRVEGKVAYAAERYGVNEGASSNDIESVLVDKFGDIWIGGRYLSRFNYKTKTFKNYYEEDGLQSYLFGTASSCKARNGMLFFGGLKGMNYFIPDTTVERKQYNVVFSRVIVDGKTLQVGDTLNGQIVLKNDLQYVSEIKLAYPCNNLTIEFSSLSYAQKKSIQYRYKLEGFDREWVYINGKNPHATYPRLPYNNYKFVVEVGVDNQWAKFGNSIQIGMLPPWWLSIWAYIIYTFITITILLLIVRYSINWISMKRQIALQIEREKHKEELLELKMNFFTNISHEFKTPLTLINAAVSDIETKHDTLLGDRYFRVIKRNNSKLLQLISELMDFQRSNASLIELNPTEIDVCKFVQEIFEEFLPLSERLEIDMKLILPSAPIIGLVDEECLVKISSNVISNSLRYTEKGGKIVIQLAKGDLNNHKSKFNNKILFADDSQNGEQLILSVTDTGVGISAESLPTVFERFHTINSKTSKHLGSGIGLALVKSLVKLQKGSVFISSERNVGTEFVFSIPLNDSRLSSDRLITDNNFDYQEYFKDYKSQFPDGEILKMDALQDDDSKPTVLLVDDNQEILMMLFEHFKADYNILLAEDGVEALKICIEKYPDIVISDVMMPKMNGLELCNIIKSQLKTCFIPVILLTARGTTEQQIEGLEEGADAYVPKPFHSGLLRSIINNLLNKAKKVSQQRKVNDKALGEVENTRTIVMDQKKQKYIDDLSKLIEINLTNPTFTVDNICQEMGTSRSRLYAQIKSITNETLGDLIREVRLRKASELFRTTSLSIGEVAFLVGIDSPSYFTRSFKERFGMTPSEYVKKLAK